MIETATWLPPSQCGCQFRITADWPSQDDITDGTTSRHPKPFTVQNVTMVNCCARHQVIARGNMPSTDHLFDTDRITGKLVQKRGYLTFPIDNPTPDQIVYHYLCGHKGQTHSLPCGCAAHMWGDFSGNYQYVVKEGVTRKCLSHQNDTVDMQQAQADFDAAVAASDGIF